MVKVQKPKPKTLKKLPNASNGVKKQKTDKIQKSKNTKNVVTGKEAGKGKAKEKAKLIKETIKETQIAQPLKKLNKQIEQKQNAKSKKPQKNQSNQKQQPQKPQTTTTTQLEQTKNAGKKQKSQTNTTTTTTAPAKRPLILAPPVSPATTTTTAPAKRPLILAPPVSPATVNVKKPKNKKKTAKSEEIPVSSSATATGTEKKKSKKAKLAVKPNKEQGGESAGKGEKKDLKKNKKIGKKSKQPKKKIFEPVPFDENKFNEIVNVQNVQQVVEALKTIVEEEVSKRKSIFSDYQYFLNVASFKIPNVPKRMVKLNVKHSIVDKESDVLIIVPDLQRGSRIDYEPTIQHYEDFFREAGVEGLKIMPFNQLRTEYSSFEAVRKLASSYDYYLCDGRVVGHAVGLCGKIFQKPRTTFHAVHLHGKKNIKQEIEKALHRTAFKQLNKGDLIAIPVGNHKFTMQQLAENILFVVEQLRAIHPGGLENIRNMHVRIDVAGTTSLPIYMGVGQAPPEKTPYVIGTREQRMIKLKKEANEVLSKFNLTKDGDLVKSRRKQIAEKRKLEDLKSALLSDGDDDDEEEAVGPAKKARKVKHEMVTGEKSKKVKKANKAEGANDAEQHADNDSDDDEVKNKGVKKLKKDDSAKGKDEDADNAESEEAAEDDADDDEGDDDEDDDEDDDDESDEDDDEDEDSEDDDEDEDDDEEDDDEDEEA